MLHAFINILITNSIKWFYKGTKQKIDQWVGEEINENIYINLQEGANPSGQPIVS